MEIIQKRLNELVPYEKNARRNNDAVKYVANSIEKFGFQVPIVIDKNNVIICGHTRYKASQKLKLELIPCVIASELTDEQIKAYRLADNKVSEKSKWDVDVLGEELDEILNFDMSDFGFKPIEYKENERQRTNDVYHLDDVGAVEGEYDMPTLEGEQYIPDRLIGFNYVLSSEDKNYGVHFYIDDYQFERLWNNTEKYIKKLRAFECVLTPDFSLYLDMPESIKIWNTYRSRLIGQKLQGEGIIVIPTVSWADEKSFKYCFDGLPKKSVLSISTVGIKRSSEALNIFKTGVNEMIKRCNPSDILLYGGMVEGMDFGKIKIHEYSNEVTERMKNWEVEE